ncbi:STAS domain-containing protein [Wenzhouxiangella limi]|uniref:STAS domain-containing protein n=1 Tax=Wenzhouxiangella limi TaxID=2707351 RepID=A0A845V2D4_9GAMM|nr:STAS domain-containing protein [Wenzhouxiangella limi]NDY94441.1 STAS domain-containing protein [Wenzhouxiangella limi]
MLKADAKGRVALSGALTSKQVPELYRSSLPWQKHGLPDVIDLADVERADSSALALLLEWRSWADAAERELRIINVPRSLCVLASLSQIGQLLGWRAVDFESDEDDRQCCA